MAKARSRTAARKIKDRWKAKSWYNILAPSAFDSVTVADTLADSPESLMNRVTGVSLQDLTNDFRKSHITLYFKINKVEESNAHTQFAGHTLTSDYLRRMIRRRRSKIEGVYDVTTRDGAVLRVKPFATTDKRIQNSQRKVVRDAMKKTIDDSAKVNTLNEFVKEILDGKIGSDIYKNCKKLYPVKRIEIYKTEVITPPTIMIEDKKPKKKEEKTEEKPEEPEKKEKKPAKKEKKTEEVKESEKKEEEKSEDPKEHETKEKPKKEKPAKPKKKAPAKKPAVKKTPAKKPAAKKPAKAKTTAKKRTTSKKKTSKK
jgi:small subunit ribosomal protein S3Ae